MARNVRSSLAAKAVVFCLFVSLLPAALVGYFSFWSARNALQAAQLEKLEAARDLAAESIADYLLEISSAMRFLGNDSSVTEAYEILSFYGSLDKEAAAQGVELQIDSDRYKNITVKLDPLLKHWIDLNEPSNACLDLFTVVGLERGHVSYSVKREGYFDTDLRTGPLKDSLLAKLYDKVCETGKPAMADFSVYEGLAEPAAFLGVPVFKEGRQFLGMLAVRLGPQRIASILMSTAKLGRTGDAFIFGDDLVMRSNSRFRRNSMLKEKVDTRATRDSIQGVKGIGEVAAGDAPELQAWSPVGLKNHESLAAGFDWGIVVRIDTKDAFAPVTVLGRRVALAVPLIGLAAALVAFILVRTVTGPVAAMARAASDLSAGNLAVEVPRVKRKDEIGALVESFRHLAGDLSGQVRQLLSGINVISSSAKEISAAVSQTATSTARTSAAVTETTVTVEQVRQAAALARVKAKDVSVSSKRAVEVSAEGMAATEATITGMNAVKTQMESIGETVLKLGEQSRAIEGIIQVVRDLADQSNLLAVNASIEAARAGEQGKGFAVVAGEIKNLADQSKGSTAKVGKILADIRKWIDAVVMATEQGSRAVDAGVQQSQRAGQSIRTLAETVGSSAQAAVIIESASEQQAAGVDQVSQAMGGIESAARRNADGMAEIEQAARNLDRLGLELEKLASYYKLPK